MQQHYELFQRVYWAGFQRGTLIGTALGFIAGVTLYFLIRMMLSDEK